MTKILRQASLAIATYLRDAAPLDDIEATSIYAQTERGPAGTDADAEEDSTPLPRVLVTCSNGTHIRGSGNWVVNASVELSSDGDAEDVDERHAEREEAIGARLMPDSLETLATGLSTTIEDFTCMGVEIDGVSHSVDGRRHVSTLTLRLLCCPSDIS